ncbi:hypothetical protein E1258_07460 [Micromonospora sp. KC207]|uniref:DUF6300 family protein n=1 Tax=Micromonospora sp. KC207 TaxID=2530377 RepID=UPI0010502758|nr:DUF6300 family protein [Micromonospora sp. KC207]TDC64729.1 hypothetical protein E1258_07460 [Micromonospora sp. KC207]
MDIQLGTTEALPCRRCGGFLHLAVTLPHPGWCNAKGEHVRGYQTIGLCPSCDDADPKAQALLAFFVVNERAGIDSLSELRLLVEEWMTRQER